MKKVRTQFMRGGLGGMVHDSAQEELAVEARVRGQGARLDRARGVRRGLRGECVAAAYPYLPRHRVKLSAARDRQVRGCRLMGALRA